PRRDLATMPDYCMSYHRTAWYVDSVRWEDDVADFLEAKLLPKSCAGSGLEDRPGRGSAPDGVGEPRLQGSSLSVSSAAACTACGEYGQGRLTFEAQSFV